MLGQDLITRHAVSCLHWISSHQILRLGCMKTETMRKSVPETRYNSRLHRNHYNVAILYMTNIKIHYYKDYWNKISHNEVSCCMLKYKTIAFIRTIKMQLLYWVLNVKHDILNCFLDINPHIEYKN